MANYMKSCSFLSALDKLLGQLGIYTTWLSSIAYLQKQLRIFIYFYATFFSVITRFHIASSHRECACIFIHSHCLPFLSMKLADFIVPIANLIPLLTFQRVHFAKFHFHHIVFPRNTGLDTDILFTKKELFCLLASKKNQYPTGICLLPKWKQNGPNGTQ